MNKCRRKNKNRIKRQQEARKLFTENLSKEIQEKGLVLNFSSVDVPDAAFIYLSLGDNFITTPPDSPQELTKFKDNLILDTKEFLRKLAWKVHFQDNESTSEYVTSDSVKKLKLNSRSWPILANKHFDDISDRLLEKMKNLQAGKSNCPWYSKL